MKVQVSRIQSHTVTEYYGTEEFEVPDSMAEASEEEIIAYLQDQGMFEDRFEEYLHYKWKNPQDFYEVVERDGPASASGE